ncbi:hypothetical protein E2562_039356 [Oryza meyeriana var. granulata]|uniref:EGF-like domain-containing protein n=1 Tax=Oryza meyeriana var. granulata TaxID=110450 RepID=A0A6G1F2B8_9ORYZ|nr:hypothetical protein E2562_039356 [Oryza meyeriana var. granulata]
MLIMLLHLHLAAVTALLAMAMSPATAVAADQQSARRPIALPGCPDKCGNISIPYPFGIKEGCYFDINFSVICNLSTTPPATATGMLMQKSSGYYFGNQQDPVGVRTDKSWWTVDLIDIDVARGEVRVAVPVSSDCSTNESYHEFNIFALSLNFSTTFLFSPSRNVLMGVGQSVSSRISGLMSGTNYSATCSSLFDRPEKAQNGTCTGLGCCEAELAPELGMITVGMRTESNSMWKTFPCTYSMAVERSWYNFSLQDLYGYGVLDRKFAGGVPLVLDFAIRNESCPSEGKPLPTACRSSNSFCVNATNGQGYVCKCQEGYEGNPYLPDGCQDIDECKLRDEQPTLQDQYRCYGICKNTVGSYDCRCRFGMKGDAKTGTCTQVFPLSAMVATIGKQLRHLIGSEFGMDDVFQ